MGSLFKRDALGGALLILIGAGAIGEGSTLSIGRLTQMGAGYFPIVLGCILVGLGALLVLGQLISVDGVSDDATNIQAPDWRGCAAILVGMLSFLLIGGKFGLAPATFVCVFIASVGDRSATFRGALALATGMTILSSILFVYLLRIPFPVVQW